MSLARVVSVCQYGFASKDLTIKRSHFRRDIPTGPSDGSFFGPSTFRLQDLGRTTSRDIREPAHVKARTLRATPSLKPLKRAWINQFSILSSKLGIPNVLHVNKLSQAHRCSQQCKTLAFGISAFLGFQGVRGVQTLLHTHARVPEITVSPDPPYASGVCCIRLDPCAIAYSVASMSLRMHGRGVERSPAIFPMFLHVLVRSI